MREHANLLKKDTTAHLSAHCRSCPDCEPLFFNVRILGKSKNKTARELLEAYHIQINGLACVSQTTVTLYDSEMRLLSL